MTPLPGPLTPEWRSLAAVLSLAVSSPPTVAEQVAVARLARGITQTMLAAATGLRRAGVADIESGRGDGLNPKLDKISALAAALEIDLVVYARR